jgi:hypothetical protein
MKNSQTLLKALESIAYDSDRNDILHSLDVIRGKVAGVTTDSLPLRKKASRRVSMDWTIKSAAFGLLTSASKVAWSKEQNKKQSIMLIAASYMGQYDESGSTQERQLGCLFVVRAVWKKKAPALELVGPVNAEPRFLIGYAFWLVAKSLPASVWRRTERNACKNCGNRFVDIKRKGRPRKYCSEACYVEAHAKLDKRNHL